MTYDFLDAFKDELLDEEWFSLELLDVYAPSSSQTIHDHLQFQADFDFDLLPDTPQEESREYTVDAYFFLPHSMGINRENFSRDQFYTSLTNYLRIRTPDFSEYQADTLIPSADAYFKQHLFAHLRQALEPLVIQEVKLFGCNLNTQLKKLRSLFFSLYRPEQGLSNAHMRRLESMLIHILQYLSDFRSQYLGKVRYQSYLVDAEVRRVFVLVDEYLSYRLEASLIRILQYLEARPCHFAELLENTLLSEMEYREAENLIRISDQTDKSMRERYYYRLGLLKKYVSEVLFLRVENLRKDKLYRNLVAAAGAALAALWAGLIDLQRFYLMASSNNSQDLSDFTLRFFLIVIVGVVAYIFKDRIKELSREFFYSQLKHKLPDYEFEMVLDHYHRENQRLEHVRVGYVQQMMRFLSRDHLPAEIQYIRDMGHRTVLDPERHEHILHFSQTLQVDTHTMARQTEQIQRLHNILRFNVAAFLEKLDTPDKTLRYYDLQNGLAMIKAPKVYHVNVVFRYSSQREDPSEDRLPKHYEFERIRLILDKSGIQRIEPILARGELGYTW